ncbi:MAG: phosphate acyltransferase, partial [Steroidobacteraceae bacterium]
SRRESARRMRDAFELFARQNPDVECDGEMHGDAALSEVTRRGMLMDSRISGEANILICPNVDAANILFNVLKVVDGEGTTVGPILMGVAAPAHVLTPSSTSRRILNMTALAAAQADMPAVVKRAVGA